MAAAATGACGIRRAPEIAGDLASGCFAPGRPCFVELPATISKGSLRATTCGYHRAITTGTADSNHGVIMQAYIRPASTLLLFTGFALIAGAQQAPGPAAAAAPAAPPAPMGFFVTSENPGKGGDLGGLAGADAHCQKLAAAAGAGARTWRAYLSTP